jgi:hypothetical protein
MTFNGRLDHDNIDQFLNEEAEWRYSENAGSIKKISSVDYVNSSEFVGFQRKAHPGINIFAHCLNRAIKDGNYILLAYLLGDSVQNFKSYIYNEEAIMEAFVSSCNNYCRDSKFLLLIYCLRFRIIHSHCHLLNVISFAYLVKMSSTDTLKHIIINTDCSKILNKEIISMIFEYNHDFTLCHLIMKKSEVSNEILNHIEQTKRNIYKYDQDDESDLDDIMEQDEPEQATEQAMEQATEQDEQEKAKNQLLLDLHFSMSHSHDFVVPPALVVDWETRKKQRELRELRESRDQINKKRKTDKKENDN